MKMPLETSEIEIVTDKSVYGLVDDLVHSDQEEPVFVADLADIVYKFKMWKLKLPRIQPFYAVKCNDSSTVIHLLAALGTGFDCASRYEIESVLNAGVEPSRIIYANPCKTRSFIKHAANVGVDLMTFDNEMELHKVKILHPDARLIIRIRVDDSSAACGLGLKFGCEIEDTTHLLQVAKELDLNIVGVSFHVGSDCRDPSAYSAAIDSAKHVFDIASELGYEMDILDIGGGFPGSRDILCFEEISVAINQSLDEHFPVGCGVEIIGEPGRYFVASAFTLCANIIAKRNHIQKNDEPCCMYYLNDGVYGSFNCLIFDHVELKPIPLVDSKDRPILKSSVWGPTCDSIDRVLEEVYLPSMNVGEWLVFENMGAYTVSAASTFNGFQKPIVKCILPVHVLTYLQQLPTWSNLLEAFGHQLSDYSSEDCSNLTNAEIHLPPRPESVSA